MHIKSIIVYDWSGSTLTSTAPSIMQAKHKAVPLYSGFIATYAAFVISDPVKAYQDPLTPTQTKQDFPHHLLNK